MTSAWLRDQGFEGFIRFQEISSANVPNEHGVYAVARETKHEPIFAVPGTGRKGSHYSLEVLRNAWVSDAVVLYFGRAQCQRGIYERLNKYRRFGKGRRSGHSGGRAIWQLTDAQDLKVCWLVTPTDDSKDKEAGLIDLFKLHHQGARPFANRIDGKMAT